MSPIMTLEDNNMSVLMSSSCQVLCFCPCIKVVCARTVGVQEGGVELSGQQRIRYVSEKLFEQRRHVMDAVLLIQLDVHPHVEVLPQLGNTHTNTVAFTLH